MFSWYAPNAYLATGRSALACIMESLAAAHKRELGQILDFGSGYGRVLRFLSQAFPEATITASEVDPDAVEFCARTFGAVGVASRNDPHHASFASPFDLIWAGSVFTHLTKDLWEAWLPVLGAALVDDGVLVFSTHGPEVEANIRGGSTDYGLEADAVDSILHDYRDTGFGYGDYPGLDASPYRHLARYGITVVNPSTVHSLAGAVGLRVVHYIPTGWSKHQDVYACCWV